MKSSPIAPALERSTTFAYPASAELAAAFAGRSDRVYGRFGNPTVAAAARALARLEGADEGLLFASGMAAITTTLLALTREHHHVVAQGDVFAQTFTFLESLGPQLGLEVTFVDGDDVPAIAGAIRRDTGLVYVETPSNPLLRVVDLAEVARAAARHGVPLVVDSTFAPPVIQRPIGWGASLVVHSATKYLGGHADLSCGAVSGRRDLVQRVGEMQRLLGGIAHPDTAWLLERSLKTLELRVLRQSATAADLAARLQTGPGVLRVHHPFLHPARSAIARRQMEAGGGMVSFELAGGVEAARRLLDGLRLVRVATSLGGVDSIAEIPADLDFGDEMGATARPATPPGLVRLSVGLEPVVDLWADIRGGLDGAR